jgi:asparagine synthase (glutamine-hydrolysing)
MCGVAGIYAYHHVAASVDPGELRAIRDHMAARGPDGTGQWVSPDGRVGLAHRRLAIIDLADRAAQPMASADGQLVVSFNGEIYNYRELRKELQGLGCEMRTESDTEVLLHLYARQGTAMLGRLRGMFAFALWDNRKQALLLARDPFGIKPLYLADDGWTVRLASQVKALIASPRVSRAPEPAALAGFYLFGSVPEPFTLYQEIRSVPAGSYQWVDSLGPQPAQAYFDAGQVWADAERFPRLRPAQVQPAVRAALVDSVKHHLVADVPVGAFLSAGIDSGALVGLMRDAGQEQLRTVTLAFQEFEGTVQDESVLAAQVARHYGVEHSRHVVSEAEFRADLPRILAAMDQPSIDGVNTWFISKAAREAGLKVAVSGLGGDELFGGYPSFRDIPRWMRLMWLPARLPGLGVIAEQVQAAFASLFPRINPKAAGMLRYGGRPAGAYLLKRGLFLPQELPGLLGAETAHEGLRRLKPLNALAASLSAFPKDSHATVATLEMANYMRNQLLRDTDWASMAHSLEVRTPLVDATLLRAAALPLLSAPPANRKQLLAASPSLALPAEVANRAKTGFTTPIADWQQRGDAAQVWNQHRSLAQRHCPWARRWGHWVMSLQQGA